jgi:hypothetical protein
LVDESNLPDGVFFRQPSYLSFADHVHRLVPSYRIHCALDRSEAETGSDSLLDESMVLFNDVVQVR